MCSIKQIRINLKLYFLSVNFLMKMTNGNGFNKYRIATWNCRKGLIDGNKLPTAKVTEIKHFLYEMNIHLLCVTEVDIHGTKSTNLVRQKLSQSEVTDALHIPDYSIQFPTSWMVYGVARLIIYVKKDIKIKVHKTPLSCADLPAFSCEIGIGREKKTVVGCYYREFTSAISGLKDKNSQKERLIRHISEWNRACERGSKDVMILGDSNLCIFKWDDENYHDKEMAEMVKHFLLENNCKQMVAEYTRSEIGRGGTVVKSCIDHIYTNSPEKVQTFVQFVGDSDHLGVIAEKATRIPRLKPNVVKKRSYKGFDIESFLNDINESDINKIVSEEKDFELAAEKFEKLFKDILDKHAPVRVFQQRKNYLPFLSDNTKKTITERHIVMKEAVKQGDKDLLKEGKRLSRVIKSLIKADETKYYEEGLDIYADSKRAWKVVKEVLNVEDNLSPTSIETKNSKGDEIVASNPLKIADEFNNFLTKKVSDIREKVSKMK